MQRKKRHRDFCVIAFRAVEEVTKEEEETQPKPETNIEGKNPAAVALGRLGTLKGGKARAEKLTSEQRKEIAQRTAKARSKRRS